MTQELINGDATGTAEEQIVLPEASHTIPNQHELDAQAKLSPALIGCHRKGLCSCEVRYVEDGFAYRPYGSADSVPWQWMRTADFERDYEVFSRFDSDAMIGVIRLMQQETERWRRRAKLCVRVMGNKSKQRLADVVKKEMNGSL